MVTETKQMGQSNRIGSDRNLSGKGPCLPKREPSLLDLSG
jgi:hypothetical protein